MTIMKPQTTRRAWCLVALWAWVVLYGIGMLLRYGLRARDIRVDLLPIQNWRVGQARLMGVACGPSGSRSWVEGTIYSLGCIDVYVPAHRTTPTGSDTAP
jgi:hypothetical protein